MGTAKHLTGCQLPRAFAQHPDRHWVAPHSAAFPRGRPLPMQKACAVAARYSSVSVRLSVLLSLVAALGAGLAVPLLWEDDQSGSRQPLSARQIEDQLLRHPPQLPFGGRVDQRPASVNCRATSNKKYRCVVWWASGRGIAERFGYDLDVDPDRPASSRKSRSTTDPSDEQQIRAVSTAFNSAQLALFFNDAAAYGQLCSLVTRETKVAAARALAKMHKSGGCRELWKLLQRSVSREKSGPERDRTRLRFLERRMRHFQIDSIRINGDTAIVTANTSVIHGEGGPTVLKKEDGRWLIAGDRER